MILIRMINFHKCKKCFRMVNTEMPERVKNMKKAEKAWHDRIWQKKYIHAENLVYI
jgi:hypothetical protein